MRQRDKPTLPYADAGPISASLSDNPMPHHVRGGKMGHQSTRSCRENRPAAAAYRQNPVRSAQKTLQP